MPSSTRDHAVNEYISSGDYAEISEPEKHLIRAAFNAGRVYEASLFADVISTIANELKRYRAATKEE